jgi:tetratricopeptide (TPR) repeat protein
MTTVLRICLLLLACAAAAGAAPHYPGPTETWELLKGHKFTELDQHYGGIQAAYRNGEISDEVLRAAFRNFYDTDPDRAKWFDAWVKHSPKSYVAHLARGIYYKFVGRHQDGDEADNIARQEFELSLPLDPKPLLTYLHAVDLSRSPVAARELLDRAIAIEPHNYIVREKFMGTLQSQQGGNTAMMKQFLEECRGAGLTDRQMATLQALIVEDEAWVAQHVDQNDAAALSKYQEAAALDTERNCDACGPVIKAAELLVRQKDYKGAIGQYSQVLARNPYEVTALSGRGYCLQQLGHYHLAATDLLTAARFGNAYGMTELARTMLLDPTVPANNKEPAAWLESAARLGYSPARELLETIRHNGGKLPPAAPNAPP